MLGDGEESMLKFWKFWGNDVIEFYCHPDLKDVIPEPRPAVKNLPEWFRGLPPTAPNRKGQFGEPLMTAKKCFPMLDAMSLGFTIGLAGDLNVSTNYDCSVIDAKCGKINLAEFHDMDQVGGKGYPGYPGAPIKFINYWVIKTAPGWSTLFIPPINHFNRDFTCLGGLVDTDRYPKEVNFPAVWHTADFDDTLPAGTPLVTAIPIKRNSFNKKVKVVDMDQKKFDFIKTAQKIQDTRASYYTRELREKK